jgi:hypothetical protein
MINAVLYKLELILRSTFEVPEKYDSNHILLASFPKAGNTYMRFLLSNIHKQISIDTVEVDFHGIKYYTPEIRGNRGLENVADSKLFPIFLKTHFANIPQFDRYKKVLIKREPVKTLASYQQYLEGEHGYSFKSSLHFLKHWRYGVSAYCAYYNSWYEKADYIIEYENLVKNPLSEIQALLNQFELNISPVIIQNAIDASSRKNMETLRKQKGDPSGKNPNYTFVSKKNNGRKIIFSESEIDFITEYIQQKLK